MSRLNNLTTAAIRAMFSSEVDEQLITLIEIKDPTKVEATNSYAGSNLIKLTSADNYNIDDNIIFSASIGGLVAGTTYYIVDIDYTNDTIKVSLSPRGTVVALGNSTGTVLGERVFRIADSWKERLSYTTDSEVVYGVISNSKQFIFIPVEITLPNETESGETSCKLQLNYVTPELVELIRTNLNKPASVTIQLVLGSSPNDVEAEFSSFFISNVSYTSTQIIFDLNMINYSREPFPAFNFTPIYFPGLF